MPDPAPPPVLAAPAWVTCAPSGELEEAQRIARRCGLRFVPRTGTLRALLLEACGTPVLVLGKEHAVLHFDLDTPRGGRRGNEEPAGFRLTPGMALLRLQRAVKGEVDPLVRFGGLRAGDRVLDLTLGLGGDALVAAQTTQAPVVGLESSAVLAACAMASLPRVVRTGAPAGRAGALIEVVLTGHQQWLAQAPSRSFDVVLLDPMFRAPSAAAPAFDLIRAFAVHAPLTAQTLLEARRVAARCVLVKDAAPGLELARLGLLPLASRRFARVVFGRAEAL